MSLIVLEGLDGSGKGTQTRLLWEALSKMSQGAAKVSFPDYDSPSSALVKMYLGGEFGKEPGDVNAYAAGAFYAVDRFASFKKHWQEDYNRGVPILADRYTTSNMIYQLEKLPRKEWEAYLLWTEDFEYGKLGLPKPDLVIYLDMPVEISQRLLLKRYGGDSGKKDIHESHLDFLARCAQCAKFTAQRLGWTVIPCAQGNEPLPPEEIHARVLEQVKKVLKGG